MHRETAQDIYIRSASSALPSTDPFITGKNRPETSYPRQAKSYSKGLEETMMEISQCRE